MPDMTDERLAEIEARAEAATPGPWEQLRAVRVWSRETGDWVVCRYDSTLPDDARFIAHARQDIPDLLDALKAATARANSAENLLREFALDTSLSVPTGHTEAEHYGSQLRSIIGRSARFIAIKRPTND